jgi:bifunctional non-homologous end joining protein LigD
VHDRPDHGRCASAEVVAVGRGVVTLDPAGDRPLDAVIDGRPVTITHPEKVLWPVTGTTKRELVDYLLTAAPALLPHLAGRATMLWRFPEGVDGKGWFQAQCRSRPPWVRTADIVGRRGDLLRYCVIEERATLAWLANLGTIELHPHGWTVDDPASPSALLFDLDPGAPAGLAEAARVALLVADRLRRDGHAPVVKTSGSLGLHVAAPAWPKASFPETKAYARGVAEALAADAPDLIVARSDRPARRGRVYVDWIENDRNRQLVAPWSPRATPIPRVSLPLAWDEVAELAAGGERPPDVGFAAAVARLERAPDLWLGTSARAPHGMGDRRRRG